MIWPIDLITERMPDLRKTSAGWRGPCPACGKRRSLPLSVRAYADGSVSCKCFTGCDAGAIMRAIGLEVRDCYPKPLALSAHRPARKPTPLQIRTALRERYDEMVAEGAPTTTATMNDARKSISVRFDVALLPLPPRLHEGGLHEGDSMWPALFRYAADCVLRAHGSTLTCDDRERLGIGLPVRVRILAEDAAARQIHAVARGAGALE